MMQKELIGDAPDTITGVVIFPCLKNMSDTERRRRRNHFRRFFKKAQKAHWASIECSGKIPVFWFYKRRRSLRRMTSAKLLCVEFSKKTAKDAWLSSISPLCEKALAVYCIRKGENGRYPDGAVVIGPAVERFKKTKRSFLRVFVEVFSSRAEAG